MRKSGRKVAKRKGGQTGEKRGGTKTGADWEAGKSKRGAKSGRHFAFGLQGGGLGGGYLVEASKRLRLDCLCVTLLLAQTAKWGRRWEGRKGRRRERERGKGEGGSDGNEGSG